MSALRKMPNETTIRVLRYSLWIFLIAIVATAAYRKFFIRFDAYQIRYTLKTAIRVVLVVGIIIAFATHRYFTRHQKCPGCGRSMRAVCQNVHPQALDYHLLYCEGCDIIWDTTIPKAKDRTA